MEKNQDLYAKIEEAVARGHQYSKEIGQIASSLQNEINALTASERGLVIGVIEAALAKSQEYSSQVEKIASSMINEFKEFGQRLQDYRDSQHNSNH